MTIATIIPDNLTHEKLPNRSRKSVVIRNFLVIEKLGFFHSNPVFIDHERNQGVKANNNILVVAK